jgi:hypothetical protein
MPISPPPFWPEKATEWIALIGGSLGGLLGTAGFILSILNYRRDRAKVRLALRTHMRVKNSPDFDPNADHLILTATNAGRRDIQLSHAGAEYYRGGGISFPDHLLYGAPVLSEKAPSYDYILKQDFDLSEIRYFSVGTPQGEHRLYLDPIPKHWWRALRTWPRRRRHRRDTDKRRKEQLAGDVFVPRRREESGKSTVTVRETRAQRMQRLGPLLAAVIEVLDEIHHFRQRFTNTFDHHNVLQRRPDPPLYARLESVREVAPTVSITADKHVAVAIERLKILDRLQQEVGQILRTSVGRGLTGEAAEEVRKQAEQECGYLEFYLKPVREEIERMHTEASE